jgi:AcrR family transcriptional regulator
VQERSRETRNRILQRAVRLFAEKGYEATGVAEICRSSDVSKGSFYHHFPSKQAMFIELLKDWLQGLDEGLGSALKSSGSVPEGLVSMAGQMKKVFSAADGSVHLFLEFWQQARRDPKVWKEFISPYRRYTEYFAGIVRRGIEEGSLRPIDPHVAGQTLVALAVGILVQGVLDPKGAAWDKVTRDALRMVINGMSSGRGVSRPRGR